MIFFCLTNFEIVCTGICIEWYWYKQVLIQCTGLHLSNCDFILTDYQVFNYDLIFEWHKKMPPPSPQKSPILDFLVHCGNAIWIYYGTESTHFEKKNRSALKLGPSQRTLKKLFKVSTCTNSSLNFNWCLRKNLQCLRINLQMNTVCSTMWVSTQISSNKHSTQIAHLFVFT